ncbi:MAG: Transcriptional regulatory protein ZraR [Syntrophaceae bacterium PtaU1.Bin231]|nr:MAG: Transcriptional regulatory protein ZraR [Syntrophaceae bacterium PtaU1.Bin231]
MDRKNKDIGTAQLPARKPSGPLLDKDKLLQSLFRISALLTAPSKLDEILKRTLDEVVDTIGFDRGIVRLFDDEKRHLETRVVKNYTQEEAERAFSIALDVRQHDSIGVKVAKTGAPIAIEDASRDPRITETDRMLTKIYGEGALFCAPLKIGNDVIGTVTVWSRKATTFFPEEISLFLAFADQMSIVIQNAKLFESNSAKIRDLMILQDAVSQMNLMRRIDNSIHTHLVQSAMKIADTDRALIYFRDLKKGRTFLHDGQNAVSDNIEDYEKRIQDSIIRKAMDANEIVIRRPEDLASGTPPLFDGYPAEMALPMILKDRFRGALYLSKRKGTYSPDQVHMLDILVKNATISYDNNIMHAMLYREAETLKSEVEKLKERESILLGFHNILGTSKKMQEVFQVIQDVATHDTNVLIQGESGTGKELTARAIHRHSSRSKKPFIDVNCAAIPGTLLESELFGYEAGAFTDAKKRKIGLLEAASGGTMFLDEVGDMSFPLQAKFLRVLEDGYIRRLGGTQQIPIDVRFVFATNREMSRMVAENKFREDLFYRISVVPIQLPPLRERREDIQMLAMYYVEEFNRKTGKKVTAFDEEAIKILENYSWPGNVRELRNVVERVMILQHVDTTITPSDLPMELRSTAFWNGTQKTYDLHLQSIGEGMDFKVLTEKISGDIKEKILKNALDRAGGNKTKAAKLLGISRFRLIREQKKLSGRSN